MLQLKNRLIEHHQEIERKLLIPSVASKENRGTEIKARTLSNVQMELLKLYSTDLEHNDLMELRKVLANHFAEKAMNGADIAWHQKRFSADTMETWLNEH